VFSASANPLKRFLREFATSWVPRPLPLCSAFSRLLPEVGPHQARAFQYGHTASWPWMVTAIHGISIREEALCAASYCCRSPIPPRP
jgi:hypothetical protein